MRDFIYAANWKMHKNPIETAQFFREFVPAAEAKLAGAPKTAIGQTKRIVFFVPALNMASALEATGQNKSIELGGQNIHQEIKGAFTGENSAAVLKSIGVPWVLVGHSERRTLFGETDAVTGLKMKAALGNDLSAMLCVGETLGEREMGETLQVISRQLKEGLSLVMEIARSAPRRIAIAYEPVWAIGTGKVASPEQATEVHQAIRQWIKKELDESVSQEIPILYGGSVKADNAQAIGAKPDIDGFLVGGASLESVSFLGLF